MNAGEVVVNEVQVKHQNKPQNGKNMDYKVIAALEGTSTIENLVKDAIKEGWQPIGVNLWQYFTPNTRR